MLEDELETASPPVPVEADGLGIEPDQPVEVGGGDIRSESSARACIISLYGDIGDDSVDQPSARALVEVAGTVRIRWSRSARGAVNDVDPAGTAYPHRTAEMLVTATIFPPQRGRELREAVAPLWPHAIGAYRNFESTHSADTFERAFPGATGERVRELAASHRRPSPARSPPTCAHSDATRFTLVSAWARCPRRDTDHVEFYGTKVIPQVRDTLAESACGGRRQPASGAVTDPPHNTWR